WFSYCVELLSPHALYYSPVDGAWRSPRAPPSYFSPIVGAWRSPRAPPVVLFSRRWCVVSLPRPTCRVFLPSIVHGESAAPHPSYYSLVDGTWQAHRASSSNFLLHP